VLVNDVMVTAAQTMIKSSNHSYVRNVLHIKLIKLTSIWKSGSGSSRMSFQIWLWLDWKKINPVHP